MSTLTVTAKGQVTLRKDILKHLGVGPGAEIAVEKLPDGRVEVRAVPAGKIAEVFDALKSGRPPVSLKRIGKIAARGWAGRW